jgi:serine/threonine protein kinase
MWICPECRQIYETNVERCERDDAPVAEVYAHQTKARYPLLGRIVGDRYHLIGGLGQGGLGTVYLAQHRHLGQLFAVKFLELQSLGAGGELDDTQKSGYRRDFLKEAQVASLVRHPSVVRVTDFGEHEGMPFLVMEYVPGPSLLQMLGARGRFPVAEAVAIGRRIAEALDAFHERRLVHRDLKPANVILDPRGDGRLTLVDLGLVKDLSGIGARASTHPLALRGTPGYLAPEQVPPWVLAQQGVKSTNEKRIVDARVDLYALGVIFYEMLAGVSPYPDGSNTAVIVYACTRDPIPFATIDPPLRLALGLETLVYDTMHWDPERRPSSAAAFLERLDAVTMGNAVQGSWPAIIAPGVRTQSGGGSPAEDPLARLGKLVPSDSGDPHDADAEEALESTAVFTDADVAAEKAGLPESNPGSAERRKPTGALSGALEIRKAAAAAPDRTLEADVLDPDDLPHDHDHDHDHEPGERSSDGSMPGKTQEADAIPDADFELDAFTAVERMSPGLQTAILPVPGAVTADAPSVPVVPAAAPTPAALPREVSRPESSRRPTSAAKPQPKRSPWRIPVAIGLAAAAAATGWYFAQRTDTTPDPEVHVVRVGNRDAAAEPPPSRAAATQAPETAPPASAAAPEPAPSEPAPPETAPPTAAPAPRSTQPEAAAALASETAPRKKPPPGGIEQLLTEGDAALSAGQYKVALERYEAFMKRAGEGHPKYWVIQPRVEKLREKLQGQ